MQHDIPELSAQELRNFGFVTGAIIGVLFGLGLPFLFSFEYPLWPWYLAGILATWAWVAPATLRGFYRTWMRFGLLMSKITTPLVIGIVFFLVITPTALIMKILGRDAMQRKIDKKMKTYRINSSKFEKTRIEKPF